jgi:aldose 1-epimerase
LRELKVHRLVNSQGSFVDVCDFGATWLSICVPDRKGRMGNILLRYFDIEDYRLNPYYLGSTVGRYANRIANGEFQLRGQYSHLNQNEGRHHLHGGKSGFSHNFWNFSSDCTSSVAKLSYLSKSGEEGYPGHLLVNQTLNWSEDNTLTLEFVALSDASTPVNLCNHAYFNLSAGEDDTIFNHYLQLNARHVLPIDDEFLPTGEKLEVKQSPFDFIHPRRLGDIDFAAHPQTRKAGGFDHTFALVRDIHYLSRAARLSDPVSGRYVEISTTKPGIQLYTGNHLKSLRRDSLQFGQHSGLCLETQYFPNSPNVEHFPHSSINVGDVYRHSTHFRFGVD